MDIFSLQKLRAVNKDDLHFFDYELDTDKDDLGEMDSSLGDILVSSIRLFIDNNKIFVEIKKINEPTLCYELKKCSLKLQFPKEENNAKTSE